MIGTGYVGLVTGTCFAESGNDVTCVDIDQKKIEGLKQGEIPIYEPGLTELVVRNTALKRLHFTTDTAAAVRRAKLIFLAVGTPQADDGAADLSSLWKVVEAIAPHLPADSIVVTKSTVPVGTNAEINRRLKKLTGRDHDVASNPEFLKEGAALDDFMKPDRVVVGVRRPEVAAVLQELYRPFLRTEHPFLVMSPESAELTKYVANALLATKISFINEISNLCERMEADINDVRRGIGHDARIGFAFLFPGVGYGGSCFPKDIRALQAMARSLGISPRILTAIDDVNTAQKNVMVTKLEAHFGHDLAGKTVAIWGLAFKPRTDDIREAPALVLIDQLLARGVQLQVHDPEAMENVREKYGDQLRYMTSPYQALEGADCLVIMTEWKEFLQPDLEQVRSLMKSPVVFDGRNLFEPPQMKQAGFVYHSIGRTTVSPAAPGQAIRPASLETASSPAGGRSIASLAQLPLPKGTSAGVRAACSLAFTEGPAVDAQGNLYFSDIEGNRILKLAADGTRSVFREPSGRTNGQTFDQQGRLYHCEGAEFGPGGGRRVSRTNLATGEYEVLTERYEGLRYNSPNDLCVDGRGRIYFTDPRYGDRSDMEMTVEGVYRIDPDGRVTRILIQPQVQRPNGIAVTQDSRRMYVVDSCPLAGGNRKIWSFDLDEQGNPSHQRLVFDFAPGRGGDGMRLDMEGNLYVAAGILVPRHAHETADVPPGVYVITPEGELLGRIPITEDVITNLAFGGPDGRTLYITGGKTIWTCRVRVPGQVAYPKWG
jgi:UDPglucose 6-dehydrogenase